MASLNIASPDITVPEEGSLTIADLQPAPGLTDQYDEVLFSICDTTRHSLIGNFTVETDTSTRFCQHMRRATNADTVYICNRTTLDVIASSSTSSTSQHCPDTLALHNALTSMICDLWNCETPFCTPALRVYPDEPQFTYVVVPLDKKDDRLAILVNVNNTESLANSYIAHAITVLYDIFQLNEGNTPSHTNCEIQVFNALQARYQNSSTAVTERRLQLFKQLLKVVQIQFSNIFTPDSETQILSGTMTPEFYHTAELWNDEFKTALDLHFLTEASHGYKTLCDSNQILQFSASRPLKLTLHTCSLHDPEYIDVVRVLLEKSILHASRIQLDIIPSKDDMSEDGGGLSELLAEFGASGSTGNQQNQRAVRYNIADEFDITGTMTPGVVNKKTSRQS